MRAAARPAATYAIQGGTVGRDRLRVLSGVLAPATGALLDRIGLPAAARCLDAGCGGGDVTRMIASRVPAGRVTGTDRDPATIALAAPGAPANVTFRAEDLAATVRSGERYDLVYARFVLSHLDPAGGWVEALAGLLAPGGTLVLEDTHIAGAFCVPPSPVFDRAVEIYTATVRAGGGDPDIGPRLPLQLARAGLADIGIEIVQPAALGGDAKRLQLLTLTAVEAAAVRAGVSTAEEIAHLATALHGFVERPDTLVTTAQVVQSWGTRRETP
jgi:SAM-dependent methyltransferase